MMSESHISPLFLRKILAASVWFIDPLAFFQLFSCHQFLITSSILISSQSSLRWYLARRPTSLYGILKGCQHHAQDSVSLQQLNRYFINRFCMKVRLKLLSGIVNSTASRVESLSESSNNRNGITNGDGVNTAGTTATSVESSLRFLVEAMAFLNAFVQSAADLRSQVVIQWEVEEAALNIRALSQVILLRLLLNGRSMFAFGAPDRYGHLPCWSSLGFV